MTTATETLTTAPGAPAPQTEDARERRKRLIVGGTQTLVGVYGIIAFGLGSRTGHSAHAAMGLSLFPNEPGALHMWTFAAAPAAIVFSAVCIACGVVRLVRPNLSRAATRTLNCVYLAAFIIAFLIWASSGTSAQGGVSIPGIISNTLIAAVPLILGALCGIVCERSGVVNVAIEGQFLFGAFASAMAATMANSVWIGLIAGCFGGALLGALLAVLANRYHIEQVVLGIVLNVFALGLTSFLYTQVLAPNSNTYNNPPLFQAVRIPGLASIPVVGEALFDQNVLLYATFVILVIVQIGLFRTRWGLRTRAVGEHPKAADTVGIKVLGMRYRNVILAGLISGLGGVWLTIGQVGAFTSDISSGKGFIALAALIVGRWNPVGALLAALLFGFAGGLNNSLSTLGTPINTQFLAMAPYLATIFVVAVLGGSVRPPAAENQPFVKQ